MSALPAVAPLRSPAAAATGASTEQEFAFGAADFERVRSLILSSSAQAIAGAIGALMTRPDSTPMLSSIHCPTLIIVGSEDILTPPSMSEAMHAAIGASELVILDQTGHLPNLEQPQRFNTTLSRFLARVV